MISDRYNRYRVLLTTQVASLVQATLLVVLVVYTNYMVWEILALCTQLATLNAFDVPARHSMVNEMVENKPICQMP